MNRDNMQRVLEFYEAGCEGYTFDIGSGLAWRGDTVVPQLCGSAGCIAGTAFVMWLSDQPEQAVTGIAARSTLMSQAVDDGLCQYIFGWGPIRHRALAFLGLPDNDRAMGHALFDMMQAPRECTVSQAAQAIRNVMDGKDPWPPRAAAA